MKPKIESSYATSYQFSAVTREGTFDLEADFAFELKGRGVAVTRLDAVREFGEVITPSDEIVRALKNEVYGDDDLLEAAEEYLTACFAACGE